eukprot:SM000032S12060  [mRNA]  locus=s32:329939:334496:+ [translate_table: standard]
MAAPASRPAGLVRGPAPVPEAAAQRGSLPACSASLAEAQEVSTSSGAGSSPAQLTYLEGNSWLWSVAGVNVLLDPVLVGELDFNMPFLYSAKKKVLKDFSLEQLPPLDCLLITQSLDDHCHKKTLGPLSQKLPDLRVIATPNAEAFLSKHFNNVTYLSPGESTSFTGSNNVELSVKATAGPVLGPPWQRPENGYIVRAKDPKVSLYYEPHCVFKEESLEGEQVDVLVSPVVKQTLPFYSLVSGQDDAVRLARKLQVKYVVPTANAEANASGLLALIVKAVGTVDNFEKLLSEQVKDAKQRTNYASQSIAIVTDAIASAKSWEASHSRAQLSSRNHSLGNCMQMLQYLKDKERTSVSARDGVAAGSSWPGASAEGTNVAPAKSYDKQSPVPQLDEDEDEDSRTRKQPLD